MESEHQEREGWLKQVLDRELEQEHIAVSEQLLEQTKRRILSEQEKERSRGFRWQPLLAAAALVLLCVPLSALLQQGGYKSNKTTAEDSSGFDFAARPAADGISMTEGGWSGSVDAETAESVLSWKNGEVQDPGISFDIMPEFVYSCGAEEEEVYLLFVCKGEEGYENRLYRLSLSENRFRFAFCVTTQTAPQNAVWQDGTLFLLLEGEWAEAGEREW